ncbi:MAG: GTP-binding protein [Rubrivivax sp.]
MSLHLQRLAVAELQQFRQPFELRGLQPGLNLFTGANESGKSTLVRALRAAFFERHRSTAVDDLRPYGDGAAAPRVELDFSFNGHQYRLSKSFLQKKRCELLVDSQRLEGTEAEDHLAQLMGFQFALKGASKQDHWGVPGLLWIEQGEGQNLEKAVLHARDHLQRALRNGLGGDSPSGLDSAVAGVAASRGDAVLEQVRTLRAELLTATGRPKAALETAQQQVEQLQAEVTQLQAQAATYRDQVDRLQRLRQAQQQASATAPWAALRQQLVQAEAQLAAAQDLARQHAHKAAELQRAQALRQLLLQNLQAAEQQGQQLAQRAAALAQAQAEHQTALAAEQHSSAAERAAHEQLQNAQQQLAAARTTAARDGLQRELAALQQRSAELAPRLQQALAEQARLLAWREQLAGLVLDAKTLQRLRQQQQTLRDLQQQQTGAATGLGFDLLPGVSLALDGDTLQGQGERQLLRPQTLVLPGLGQLHLRPGGADLPALAARSQACLAEHQALLASLGLASLAEAEAREQQRQQLQQSLRTAEQAVALLAPQGLDELRQTLHTAQARAQQLAQALAAQPAGDGAALPLAQAEAQANTAQQLAQQRSQAAQAARQALAAADSRAQAALQEHAALAAALAAPARRDSLAQAQADLVAAEAQTAVLAQQLQALNAQQAQARPDILAQDVQRLRASAESAEQQHQARERELLHLAAQLEAAGQTGLDETLAQQTAALAGAQRRLAELRQRAAALDLLFTRLSARRQALTQQLQAPLQQRLQHYLPLLFPGAQLAVDEDLGPGALSRPRGAGLEVGRFEELSFGAREQMGIVARLAYADLLRDAGRPTLLVLDDALVHSDGPRLDAMKRVLFDAAQRHQLLLFTCHPERWLDLGVPGRALESEKAQAGPTL